MSGCYRLGQCRVVLHLVCPNLHLLNQPFGLFLKATLQSQMSVCLLSKPPILHPQFFIFHLSSFIFISQPSTLKLHPSSVILHFATFKLFTLFSYGWWWWLVVRLILVSTKVLSYIDLFQWLDNGYLHFANDCSILSLLKKQKVEVLDLKDDDIRGDGQEGDE